MSSFDDGRESVSDIHISYTNAFRMAARVFEKNLGPFIFIARGGAPVGAPEGAPTRALDASSDI